MVNGAKDRKPKIDLVNQREGPLKSMDNGLKVEMCMPYDIAIGPLKPMDSWFKVNVLSCSR